MAGLEPQDSNPPGAQIKAENQAYLAEMATITSVPLSEIKVDELTAVYHSNFHRGKAYSSPPFQSKYFGSSSTDSDRVYQLIEALTDLPANVLSYGLFLPEYQAMLQRYQSEVKPAEEHRSLLLGAQNTTTIEEYVQTVRRIFPQAICQVIDVEQRLVGKSGATFEIANALKLPENYHDSFNTIHTNSLIPNFRKDVNHWDYEENRQILFNNAYKALRSDGALTMVDSTWNNSGRSDPEFFERHLERAGFKNISIHPAKQFLYRRSLDRVFQGKEEIHQAQMKDSWLFAIYATKS